MTEQTDNRKISICIATRNEFDKVIQSFAKVIADERIERIIIIDDHSDQEIFWWKLEDWLEFDAPEGKIKLGQNQISVGTSITKHHSAVMADTEFIIILNPDKVLNTIDIDYLFQSEWNEDVISQFLWGEFANRKAWLARFDEEQKAIG